MNDEFFEMNKLDATHSIDTALDQFSRAGSSDRETDDSQDVRTESKEKKSGKGAVILLLVGAVMILAAAVTMLPPFLRGRVQEDDHSDRHPPLVAADSESSATESITENVIGTGRLRVDCDIFSSPEDGAMVEGRLAGQTEVLIYGETGAYYKVSDTGRNIVGFVLREKVDTGDAESGDSSDDAAGTNS